VASASDAVPLGRVKFSSQVLVKVLLNVTATFA
jgi:hypothetical protein